MKLCIRAHDLGVKGTEAILSRLKELNIDGVQMVCYKAYEDVSYIPGGITAEQAGRIGAAFADAGKCIPLVGAYFNPVHSDRAKAQRCAQVFEDYLRVCSQMGCNVVGSETGSYHDDKWIYHPRNRTEEALRLVVETFSHLCDVAGKAGSIVAMEGAAGHCCWNVATLAEARKRIGKPTRVIFDLYNYLDETNQEEYMEILDEGLATFGKDILLFHMKDCKMVTGGKPQQVPFGTGEMDMETILKKIKAFDPDAVLTLEGTTGEDIPHAVQTIRSIWERV